MKYLIINADDFGLTRGISQGIIDGCNKGIITSASLMATMPAFDHAVSLAKQNKRLDVGIHISLTAGQPCSESRGLRSILNKGEFIKSYVHLFKCVSAGRVSLDNLRMEVAAQVEKVLETGLKISHLNSHQHVLMFPCLAKAAAGVAAEYGIPFMRLPNERVRPRKLGSVKGWGFLVVGALGIALRSVLIRRYGPLRSADWFRGLSFSEDMSLNELMGALTSLRSGLTEVACHPGYRDEEFYRIYKDPFRREMELNALMSCEARQYVMHDPVQLTDYRTMAEMVRLGRLPF